MSAAHAAVLVGLVRLWHAHIGDRTRAEITGRDHLGRPEITGRDHLGRAEITGRDHLGRAEITRAEIVEGRDHRTPLFLPYLTSICNEAYFISEYLITSWKVYLFSII